VKRFSERLKYVRGLRGYSQQKLAKLAGVSQSAIGSYETGDRETTRSLWELADALDVNALWLETGKGPMDRLPQGPGEPSDSARGAGRPAVAESQAPYLPAAAHGARPRAIRADWPFPAIPPARYEQLSARDKRILEQIVTLFIEACQPATGSGKGRTRRG
jgi:transcriptional regulator with XRE-family HTH domain